MFSVFSVCCVVFAGGIASLLGASGESYELLCDYIRGYAPGILPQTLTALLMALCSFNNDIKRSYWAIFAMVAANTAGDLLLIGSLGLFGIGLASSISSLAAFLVLLPGFCKKDKLFYFQLKDGVSLKLVLQAALRGLPSLMLSGGVIIKNYLFNYSLNHYAGAAGVAVVDIACIFIVLISVLVFKRKFDLSLPALLKLPDNFGAKPDEYLTFSAVNMEDMILESEKVIQFCLERGLSPKLANNVGLCVEEIAGNVLEHGFEGSGEYYADVRVVYKDDELTVRVRDNCREFDPRKRIEKLDPDHPEQSIGIRIVANAARQIDYYNNAGINTMIMKF